MLPCVSIAIMDMVSWLCLLTRWNSPVLLCSMIPALLMTESLSHQMEQHSRTCSALSLWADSMDVVIKLHTCLCMLQQLPA